jgi:hypothetical protein
MNLASYWMQHARGPRGEEQVINFDEAIHDPAAHFQRPRDILNADGLSRAQRLRLLRQWEYDAMQLQVATEENMPAPGKEQAPLQEIHAALEQLNAPPTEHGGGTKYG